ncbi:MAG: hypothetical protein IJ013_10030 [Bacteroidaceae bacterium]|nr:hypothetical protein [Bacteroidaceae bacterium]
MESSSLLTLLFPEDKVSTDVFVADSISVMEESSLFSSSEVVVESFATVFMENASGKSPVGLSVLYRPSIKYAIPPTSTIGNIVFHHAKDRFFFESITLGEGTPFVEDCFSDEGSFSTSTTNPWMMSFDSFLSPSSDMTFFIGIR